MGLESFKANLRFSLVSQLVHLFSRLLESRTYFRNILLISTLKNLSNHPNSTLKENTNSSVEKSDVLTSRWTVNTENQARRSSSTGQFEMQFGFSAELEKLVLWTMNEDENM